MKERQRQPGKLAICPVCGREILPDDMSEERYDGKLMHRKCAVMNFTECDACGKWFPSGSVEEVGGRSFCRRHLEEKTVLCERCEERVLLEDATEIGGEFYCEHCRDRLFVECAECGEWVRKDECSYVDSVDGYVCESCLDDYSSCECCEGLFRTDDMRRTYRDGRVCDSCYENNYTSCEECGIAVNYDDEVYRGGRYYCPDCDPGEDAAEGVMGYHGFGRSRYVPRRCDGDDCDRLHFGVELECERGRFDISDFGRWTEDDSDSPLVHFEEDGSLDCGGVEAITQPCTLRYHQEEMDWRSLCATLEEQGFRSHNTSNCGLHVHISRDALKPTTIVKMDVFVNRAKDFFSVIARRESFYGCGGKYDRGKMADKRKALRDGDHSERYTAVNTTNRDTVEVRIFRGTLRHETILGTIEMLHGLVNFLDNMPVVRIYETERNVAKFIDYLAENHGKYPHVLPMMRRLFVEPRSHREDYAKRIGKWYGQLVKRTADENEI